MFLISCCSPKLTGRVELFDGRHWLAVVPGACRAGSLVCLAIVVHARKPSSADVGGCHWTLACCVPLLAQAQFGDVAAAIMWGSFGLDQAVVWAQVVDHAVSYCSRFAHMMQASSCVSGLIIGSVAIASVLNAASVSVHTLCCGVPTPQRATLCICSVC